jgi:hypothetical protein
MLRNHSTTPAMETINSTTSAVCDCQCPEMGAIWTVFEVGFCIAVPMVAAIIIALTVYCCKIRAHTNGTVPIQQRTVGKSSHRYELINKKKTTGC